MYFFNGTVKKKTKGKKVMIMFICFIAMIAINGCALCVLTSKWEEFKEDQRKIINEFEKKIFEHVRKDIQECNIEIAVLRKDFKKLRDFPLK